MIFANSEVLWLLLFIPILFFLIYYCIQRKKRILGQLVHSSLIPHLVQQGSKRMQIIKIIILLCSLFFLIIALSRPQYGTQLELIRKKGNDILILVDVSLSMNANDLKPSRLERAKHEINNFIDKMKGNRIGLIAFAGEAFLQCPLTVDYPAIKIFLDILSPDLIGTQGTAIGNAIDEALSVWDGKKKNKKVILLLTDGEDHSGQALEAAQRAKEENTIIFTVGIGSGQGVPIPLKDPQGNIVYKKDQKGNIVSTKLDGRTLREISTLTGGQYYQAIPGFFKLDRVVEQINNLEKNELEEESLTQYKERFQIPLLLALFFLILEQIISNRQNKKKKWKGRFN